MPVPPSDQFGGEIESAAETIVEESVGSGLLGQGADIRTAAVGAGDEGRRRKGQPFGLGAKLAMGWMGCIIAIAILSKTGILTWGDPFESVARCARKGPFADEGTASGYLLGCDSNGRSMAAWLALGAWTSMLVATGAIALGFLVGGTLGLIAGYFGGKADTVLTGMFNVLLSVPSVIMALAGGVPPRQPERGRDERPPARAHPHHRHRGGVHPTCRANHPGQRTQLGSARSSCSPPAPREPRTAA